MCVFVYPDGQPATGSFVGHVHNKPCDVEKSGGHWQVVAGGPADATNELWLGGRTSALAPAINDQSIPIAGVLDADVQRWRAFFCCSAHHVYGAAAQFHLARATGRLGAQACVRQPGIAAATDTTTDTATNHERWVLICWEFVKNHKTNNNELSVLAPVGSQAPGSTEPDECSVFSTCIECVDTNTPFGVGCSWCGTGCRLSTRACAQLPRVESGAVVACDLDGSSARAAAVALPLTRGVVAQTFQR